MEYIITFLGSGALSAIISGVFMLINNNMAASREAERRKDEARQKEIERTEGLESLKKKLGKLEKDSVRTQLLLLMSDYSGNQQEILEVAQHYFADCKGNWYMTSMFSKWLTDNEIGRPEWFKGGES